jgi:pimeloyl-ACP methyl ester carboxylesterase
MTSPPLVFLPGMMCDARLYEHQILSLSRRRGVHVAPVCNGNSLQAIAENVLRDAPPIFVLIGLSMGGIVAMEILVQAMERVRGLVLLDTNPLPESADISQIRDQQIEQVRSGHLGQLMLEQVIPKLYLEGKTKDPITHTILSMAMGLGATVFENQSRALQSRPDQQDVLKSVTVPTLIGCGRHDRVCSLERHQLMHGLISGSRLEIVEDAGHLPTLEQPEATTALLSQWLDESLPNSPL